jgi:hypothetical protein
MRASTTTAGNALESTSSGGIGVLARSSGGVGKAAVRAEYLGTSTVAAAGEFQGGFSAAIRAVNGGPSGGPTATMIIGNNARDNEPPGTFAGGAIFATSSADTVHAQSFSPRLGAAALRADAFEQSTASVALASELGAGAHLTGGRCDLQLGVDPSVATAPTARRHNNGHALGELVLDAATGDLFLCVVAAPAGQVGTWRKLAGPATAGAFHPISPTRVYDSRLDTRGRLTQTEGTRVTSVANGIDLGTGAVKTPNIVPPGATAIAYNLTVAETSGAGFLAVFPASDATFGASSINWDRADQLLANAAIVQVSAAREVKTSMGGGGATHFVIDVTGFLV